MSSACSASSVIKESENSRFKVSRFKVQGSIIVGAGSACPFTKVQDSIAIVIVIVKAKAIAIANSQSSRFNGRDGLRHPDHTYSRKSNKIFDEHSE